MSAPAPADPRKDLTPQLDFLTGHPVATFIVNSDNFTIRFANRAAALLTGISQQDLQGNSFAALLKETVFFSGWLGSSPGQSGSFELNAADRKIPVTLFVSPAGFDGFSLYQIAAVPLQERNAVSADEESRYRGFIRNSPEGIYCQEFGAPLPLDQPMEVLIEICRVSGRITECNDAMARMYGFENAEQLRGIPIERIFRFDDPVNIEFLKTFFASGCRVENGESHEMDRDGKPKYFLNNAVGIIENGCLLRIWGTQRDITVIREKEIRLKENEDRFREVADKAPVMIWMTDHENRLFYLNRKWVDFTGRDVKEFGAEGWLELVHPFDLRKAKFLYDEAFAARREVILVYRLRHSDGSYKWMHDVSVPRFTHDGNFAGYIGSLTDIEDQKQKENQLLRQATILENVSDIVITTDLNFRIESWNGAAEKTYHLPAAEAIGRMIDEVLQLDYSGYSMSGMRDELQRDGIWKGEVVFTDSNGIRRYFLHTLKFICDEQGNRSGVLDVGRDITERKKIEKQLLKSEEFYRTLFADSLDGILLMNTDGIITFSSPSVRKVLGYELDDIIGKRGFDFVHPEDASLAQDSFYREVNENPAIKFIVIRLLKKNGQWLWCNVRGHNLLDNSSVGSIVVYFHDDTLQKQAREALKESEERFRSLIRDLQTGVFLSDENGMIIMSNQALAQMLCISGENILGRNVYEIMSDDMIDESGNQIPRDERPLTRTLQQKVTVRESVVGVMHPVKKERCWIMVNSNPILDINGNIKHVVCSVLEITERKKFEQKLITDKINHQRQLTQATIDGQEKERREIGKELHDNIGQQLTTIKLFLDMAKTSADAQGVEMISLAVKGVSDVINEIRSISRSLVPHTLKDLGLADSIMELVDSISRMQLLNIDFQSRGYDESKMDESQKLTLFRIVQEQLNNIVKHSEASNILLRLRTNSEEVILDIRDDGQGFDPVSLKKGLGFTNIQNRVELYGGISEIRSRPGNGCILKVVMPLARGGGV